MRAPWKIVADWYDWHEDYERTEYEKANNVVVFDEECAARWDRQAQVRATLWRYKPELAYRSAVRRAQAVVPAVRAAAMRARMGFDYGDIWNMDTALSEKTAKQLRIMADEGHAYPGEGNGYPTPEGWHNSLHFQADRLDRYVNRDELDDWNSREYANAVEGGKEAFHWIADNLENLWD